MDDSVRPQEMALAQLRSAGYTEGRGFRQVSWHAYDDVVDDAFDVAERECRGILLNRAGERAGIDPRALFVGTLAHARKWASDEMLTHWETHRRLTFVEYQAALLGRDGRAAGSSRFTAR